MCFDGVTEDMVDPVKLIAKEKGLPLSVVRVTGEAARELYQANLAVVRPDQTVAWRGHHLPENPANLIKTLVGG